MKKLILAIQAITLFGMAGSTGFSQSSFLVTPSLGFQVSFPAKESYQYQVYSSTDLTNWSAVTGLAVSCGGIETFSFGMTNGPRAYYRAEEFPPNLSNRIVGLSNIFFDNASFQGLGAGLTVSGLRAESRDFNLNDYITGQFQFDFCKQSFSLAGLQVFTNIAVVCGQSPAYYIKNATNQLTLTNGSTTLTPDVAHSITSTGQVMKVTLGVAQVFDLVVTSLPVNTQIILTDPTTNVVVSDIWQSGLNWYLSGQGGLVPGTYSLQFVPQGASTESITFRFHNDNGHQLRTLTNGMNFSTSLGDYTGDYDKSQVVLAAGQTLQLTQPGTGASLDIYNSHGVKVYGRGGLGAAIFTVSNADTYYVIYSHTDLSAHNYSTTVSITP